MTNQSQKFVTVVRSLRIVLGSIFVFSGLNGLIGLLPPPPLGAQAALVWQGLDQTGYFFPLLRCLEMIAGLLLASGWLAPLALAALVPVIVNVVGFHLSVARDAWPVAVVLVALAATVGWHHRDAFRPMLAMRSRPSPAVSTARARAIEVALGLAFLASAVAALLGKTPPPSSPAAAAMMNGLAGSGYFFPLLMGTQLVAGLLLVARRFVPLALFALAPIVVEIVAYRFIAVGTGVLAVAVGLLAAVGWLAWRHRSSYAGLFTPTSSSARSAKATASAAA
jgi:hypothetical protein